MYQGCQFATPATLRQLLLMVGSPSLFYRTSRVTILLYSEDSESVEGIFFLKIQKSNSASMCKFRPIGHNSIDKQVVLVVHGPPFQPSKLPP